VTGIATALLLQSALIGALLWEHRRRQRAELELRRRTQQIAALNRSAALGEVSAAIAHEVNQPLGSILLNAEAAERLLRAEPADVGEAREILADIRRDGRRAGALGQKVRQLFRRADIAAAPVALNRLAADVVEIAVSDPRFRGFAFDLDLAADLPAVSGDAVQLQQVVLNLVTNAAEAVLSSAGAARRVVVRTRVGTEPALASWPCSMPGRASRLRTWPRCSSPSTRKRPAAWASACRSAAALPRRTVAAWSPRIAPMAVPASA
jgi:C4-dicarboxylate-specific signal transduction histidine kinase